MIKLGSPASNIKLYMSNNEHAKDWYVSNCDLSVLTSDTYYKMVDYVQYLPYR